MAVNAYSMSCCGLVELSGLSAYVGRPAQAMWFLADVVRNSMLVTADYGRDPNDPNRMAAPPIHIRRGRLGFLFTAVVGYKNRNGVTTMIEAGRNYGEQFAQYIESNGLGTVTRTPAHASWTRNILVAYIWAVNYPVLLPFLDQLDAQFGEARANGELPARPKKMYTRTVPDNQLLADPAQPEAPQPVVQYDFT